MKGLDYHSAQERLNEYVSANGLRPSTVRNMVLEEACKLHQPFTADQLAKACLIHRISTGTIYNALTIFVSAQILHVIERQRGRAAMEYELTTSSTMRMQYICTRCGRIVDYNDKAVTRLITERKYTNFNLQHFSLIVYGECKICRRKAIKQQIT